MIVRTVYLPRNTIDQYFSKPSFKQYFINALHTWAHAARSILAVTQTPTSDLIAASEIFEIPFLRASLLPPPIHYLEFPRSTLYYPRGIPRCHPTPAVSPAAHRSNWIIITTRLLLAVLTTITTREWEFPYRLDTRPKAAVAACNYVDDRRPSSKRAWGSPESANRFGNVNCRVCAVGHLFVQTRSSSFVPVRKRNSSCDWQRHFALDRKLLTSKRTV